MNALRTLPCLLVALCCTAGCTSTDTPPPVEDVQTIPRAGVGAFGGPGAFGGGQKPTTPTAPFPSS